VGGEEFGDTAELGGLGNGKGYDNHLAVNR
jgi:hypothetical protein